MFDSSDEENGATENVNSLKIDWLDINGDGAQSVALSSLPGCRFQNIQHNLAYDLEKLESENITDVLILVTRGELRKYRVPNLLLKYDTRGFNIHHYPLEDGTSPSIDLMMSILFCLKRLLDADKKVLIHCMGGLGRACLVAACFLQYLDENITPEATVDLLRDLRGPRAIQTIKQYNFIHDFRELHQKWLTEDFDTCISR
ncbi:UNVERIFIED_CONTAM: hypothetical protein RMT77_007834 [Armadillidium vulgare]|nr:Cyclin-dependent kinase inhibitor 3 [Armadillidium vulgare]